MKKKKIWIFVVYCLLIISILVLFLIFFPKDSYKGNTQTGSSGADTETSNGTPSTEVYAKTLRLNCARQITICVDSSVELVNGFITVEPSSKLSSINAIVLPQGDASTTGLEYKNNILKAKSAGIYKLKFSVKKTATSSLTDSISVTVVEKHQDTRVEQILDFSVVDNVLDINNIFNFDDSVKNISIADSEYLSYSDNKVTLGQAGSVNLNLSLTENYFVYRYTFPFIIKEKPQYALIVTEAVNGVVEFDHLSGPFWFTYHIQDSNSVINDQEITIQISDETITKLDEITAPIIFLKFIKIGSCNVKLISAKYNVEIEITVVFK